MLSIVSDTSARPSAGRSAVPAKMTSSILPPRSARAPWAPSTHATESTMFDLPDPFGPTTTQTPGSNSSVVLSAKDLKPFSVNDLRNKRAPSPRPDGRGRASRHRGLVPTEIREMAWSARRRTQRKNGPRPLPAITTYAPASRKERDVVGREV